MKTKIAIVCIVFCAAFIGCSPKKIHNRSVVKLSLLVDTSTALQQTGLIPAGFKIKLHNGKNKATWGYADGTWAWGKFKVTAENATLHEGNLVYNPAEIFGKNKQIKLIVEPKNNNSYKDTFYIDLPRPVMVSAYYKEGTTLAPGHFIQTGLIAVFDNGKIFNTADANGAFLWQLFTVTYKGQPLKNGLLYVAPRAPVFEDNLVVNAQYKYTDSINSQQQIELDYKAHYSFSFDGAKGGNGGNGNDGSYGSTSGRNGSAGGDGGYGGHGSNGNNVKVYCQVVKKGEQKFLVTRMEAAGSVEHAIINVDGGHINISCRGGAGGDGGQGGTGGSGADAQDKLSAGIGGEGGRGGGGGNGGNGGVVTFYGDEEAFLFFNLIQIDNSGGAAGNAGTGGRGGRGGVEEKASFWSILFGGTRGSHGNKGWNGNRGANGPHPEKILISTHTLQQIMGSSKTQQ
jgi:hypothetical protein